MIAAPVLWLFAVLSARAGSASQCCWLRACAPLVWGATGFRRLALNPAEACAPPAVQRRQGSDGLDGLIRPHDLDLGADGDDDLNVQERIPVADMQVGQGPLVGIVNAVVNYGAFVDVGATRDGLVPISKVTGKFVKNIREHVKPGQEVTVWVTDITFDGRLELSMVEDPEAIKKKDAEDHARKSRDKGDASSLRGVLADKWLQGTVDKVTDYGLFVLVAPPSGGAAVPGLVHITQIRDGFVEHPSKEASEGDQVNVRVIKEKDGKIFLSMKAPAQPGASNYEAFLGVKPTDWLVGRVHHTAPFGVFVDVEVPSGGTPVRGYVPNQFIREGFVDDPAKEVCVGQSVKVRVVNVDVQRRRMSLTMRADE